MSLYIVGYTSLVFYTWIFFLLGQMVSSSLKVIIALGKKDVYSLHIFLWAHCTGLTLEVTSLFGVFGKSTHTPPHSCCSGKSAASGSVEGRLKSSWQLPPLLSPPPLLPFSSILSFLRPIISLPFATNPTAQYPSSINFWSAPSCSLAPLIQHLSAYFLSDGFKQVIWTWLILKCPRERPQKTLKWNNKIKNKDKSYEIPWSCCKSLHPTPTTVTETYSRPTISFSLLLFPIFLLYHLQWTSPSQAK